MRLWSLFAAAATLLVSTCSFAQCLPEVTARLGGDIPHLASIDSNRILVANNQALEIYNVVNAAVPVMTGRLDIGEKINKIKIVSGRAYVVTSDRNTQNVRSYTVTGAAPVPNTTLFTADHLDFDSSGVIMYVAQHNDFGAVTVTALDVSPIDFPLLLGTFTLPTPYANYTPVLISVSGSRAFVSYNTDSAARLSALNIGNPSSMTFRGAHDESTITMFGPVVASGNFAYACHSSSLAILSLTSFPAFPTAGQIDNISAFDVDVLGSTLFVASEYGGVRPYNLATPTAPSPYTPFNTAGSSNDITINGDRLYNADREGGVNILQVGNPASITQIGAIAAPVPSRVRDEVISGSTMYVLDELGLRVFSIALPDAPALLGSITLADVLASFCSSRTLGVFNGNAYITGCDGHLRVVSVTNPAAMFQRADIILVADYDTAFYNNYAYFCGQSGLKVVDISNPSAPAVVNTYAFAGVTSSVEVQGSTLYLGTRDNGLWILSLADPVSPQLVGFRAVPGRGACYGLQVSGNTVFIARDAGLEIMDVTNSANPQELAFDSSFDPDVKNPLSYRNGILHMNGRINHDYSTLGVQRIDTSILTGPVAIGTLPGYYWCFAAGASRLYSGDGDRDDMVVSSLQSQWKPAFRHQPANVAGCLDGSAQFSVNVSANPSNVTYQWYKASFPLPNSGRYVGANSPTLTILDLALIDAGTYSCVATNSCGSTTSAAAMLSFCVADFNCDQALDFFDYLDFVDQFSSGDPHADFNRDGTLDFFDYLDFVDAFSQGCP